MFSTFVYLVLFSAATWGAIGTIRDIRNERRNNDTDTD